VRGLEPAWLDPVADPEWDLFVGRHPEGRIYHLSHWKRVLQRSFPHIQYRVAVLRDGDRGPILAGIPVCTVRSWLLGNRVVSVPFAPVFDPLARDVEDLDRLLPPILDLARSTHSRRVELRMSRSWDSLGGAQSLAGFHIIDTYLHHHVQTQRPIAEIWAGMDRKSVRYMINKAERTGLSVVRADSGAEHRAVYDLIVTSRRRLGLPPIPRRFFDALWEELGPRGHIATFLATRAGVPAAGLVCLRYGRSFSMEYSGEADEFRSSGASQLLYWTATKTAVELGHEETSMGRSSVRNAGLAAFKERWGGRTDTLRVLVRTLGARREPQTDREGSVSYRMIRALARSAPPTVYRLLGELCYRHMG
jgi:hypothetical protein